jgi:hypothetical protein
LRGEKPPTMRSSTSHALRSDSSTFLVQRARAAAWACTPLPRGVVVSGKIERAREAVRKLPSFDEPHVWVCRGGGGRSRVGAQDDPGALEFRRRACRGLLECRRGARWEPVDLPCRRPSGSRAHRRGGRCARRRWRCTAAHKHSDPHTSVATFRYRAPLSCRIPSSVIPGRRRRTRMCFLGGSSGALPRYGVGGAKTIGVYQQVVRARGVRRRKEIGRYGACLPVQGQCRERVEPDRVGRFQPLRGVHRSRVQGKGSIEPGNCRNNQRQCAVQLAGGSYISFTELSFG